MPIRRWALGTAVPKSSWRTRRAATSPVSRGFFSCTTTPRARRAAPAALATVPTAVTYDAHARWSAMATPSPSAHAAALHRARIAPSCIYARRHPRLVPALSCAKSRRDARTAYPRRPFCDFCLVCLASGGVTWRYFPTYFTRRSPYHASSCIKRSTKSNQEQSFDNCNSKEKWTFTGARIRYYQHAKVDRHQDP